VKHEQGLDHAVISAVSENQADLVMRGQKPLSLPVGFEPSKYFLLFARWRVQQAALRTLDDMEW